MTVLHPKDCIATEKIQADIHVRDDSICYNLARPRDFYIYIYIFWPKAISPLDFSRKRGEVVARIIRDLHSKRAISDVFAPFSQGPEFLLPILSSSPPSTPVLG